MNAQAKFVIGIAVIVATVGFLVFTAVDQTKMYMVTVGEYLGARDAYSGEIVRIAGRVRTDSMRWEADSRDLYFTLDDAEGSGTIDVHYNGLLPDMFAEGRDVVVEGPQSSAEIFRAEMVLTSCPSKYEAEAPEGSVDRSAPNAEGSMNGAPSGA